MVFVTWTSKWHKDSFCLGSYAVETQGSIFSAACATRTASGSYIPNCNIQGTLSIDVVMPNHYILYAEIEPGHVNASKYLRVTEQHMTQLGIPVFNSAPPSASSLKWGPVPHLAAEVSMPAQPAEHQPPQATGKMLSNFMQHRHSVWLVL